MTLNSTQNVSNIHSQCVPSILLENSRRLLKEIIFFKTFPEVSRATEKSDDTFVLYYTDPLPLKPDHRRYYRNHPVFFLTVRNGIVFGVAVFMDL